MSILELFCSVDDFWQRFAPDDTQRQLADGKTHRHRRASMAPSEIMTLLILFHQSRYRTFKDFYTRYVSVHLRREFPTLLSYTRMVSWMPSMLAPLCAYLQSVQGQDTGISFVDSTKLIVCHNRRIHQHRVFADQAARGKSSTGWFFGFKLHLVVNDCGAILSWCLTPGNVDDRHPVPKLVRHLVGKLFGDKGYLSRPLAEQLQQQGLHLITKVRKNMAQPLRSASDQVFLRKRTLIETINDQLKNISQIEHTRHRSPLNFLVNLVCGLIAYCLQPRKPSLHLEWLLLPSP